MLTGLVNEVFKLQKQGILPKMIKFSLVLENFSMENGKIPTKRDLFPDMVGDYGIATNNAPELKDRIYIVSSYEGVDEEDFGAYDIKFTIK